MLRSAQSPSLVAAGRTDAGVHARGQVVHADVAVEEYHALPGRSSRSPEESLVARLAGVLPSDVSVRAVRVVPSGFDARFSAVARHYAYRIADTVHRPDPLVRHQVAWVRTPLDEAAMHRAAQPLLGEHDFVAFCRPRPGASTVRTLRRLDVHRQPGHVGLVVLDVSADAFCHHQVRALAGALLAVGAGRRSEQWPVDVLGARRRDGSVHVAAAHGLTLEAVDYPDDHELGEQAARARTMRAGPARAGHA